VRVPLLPRGGGARPWPHQHRGGARPRRGAAATHQGVRGPEAREAAPHEKA